MSMITEQIKELKAEAKHIRDGIECAGMDFPGTMAQAIMLREAADTIERLSAKVIEDNGTLDVLCKIKTEINTAWKDDYYNYRISDCLNVIEKYIDKYDPLKAGKENGNV